MIRFADIKPTEVPPAAGADKAAAATRETPADKPAPAKRSKSPAARGSRAAKP